MQIPNNIIMFWHDHSNLPQQIIEAAKVTEATHEDFNFIFADDSACLELIQKELPRFSELYRKNRIPASRSDLARLIYLFKFGGIYVDATMAFSNRISSLISHQDRLVLVRRDDLPQFKDAPEKAGIINGIMACAPQSPFILECLKKVYFNLKYGLHNFAVHAATGPIVINEVFRAIEDQSKISTLSFSHLLENYFDYLRVPGVSNQWVESQLNGIISPRHYHDINLVDEVWNSN